MSALPERAVDDMVLDHICQAVGLVRVEFDGAVHPCGCQHLDMARSWRLCPYHDGMNDGIAMKGEG